MATDTHELPWTVAELEAAGLRGGVSYLGTEDGPPVRVLEQIGAAVYDHIPDQGTVYVYKRRNDE